MRLTRASSHGEALGVHPLLGGVWPPLRVRVAVVIEVLSRLNTLLLNRQVDSDFLDVLPRGRRLNSGDLLT